MSDLFCPADRPFFEIEKGASSRRVLARGGSLMYVEFAFAAGGVGALHDHPHEQLSYCLSGEFVYTVGGESWTLKPGDSVFVPASARHGVKCVAAGSLLDAFSPQRKDFL